MEKKISDYIILKSFDADVLQKQVLEHLSDGYILNGGPFARPFGKDTSLFCQGLIKYEGKERRPGSISVQRS